MDFASLTPLEGGRSGQTFVAEAAGRRQVVRIHAAPSPRGDRSHEVDAALLRLVRGLVPVPDVLEVVPAEAATGMPALLVTSWLPGERGDLVLARLDASGQARLGRAVGELVATLAAMPMLRPGDLVDGDLAIRPVEGDGLPGRVDLLTPHLAGWSGEEHRGLEAAAVDAQALLDTVTRVCLVHGDLVGANLLVDEESLAVTGLVDWEDAHAGHPSTDLGRALRHDRCPAYADAVLAAYVDRHGGTVAAALDLARAADLAALVEGALRAAAGGRTTSDADAALLRVVAARGDVGARPSGLPRRT